MPKNAPMTPFQRIEAERTRVGMSKQDVFDAIGVSKQSYTNYKIDGLPSKYFSKCDELFRKPYGWTEFGIEESEEPAELSQDPKLQTVFMAVQDMFLRIPQDQWHLALIEISAALVKSGRIL